MSHVRHTWLRNTLFAEVGALPLHFASCIVWLLFSLTELNCLAIIVACPDIAVSFVR